MPKELPWTFVKRGDLVWMEWKDGAPGSAQPIGDFEAVCEEMTEFMAKEDFGEN
jgi:hypothetical protein